MRIKVAAVALCAPTLVACGHTATAVHGGVPDIPTVHPVTTAGVAGGSVRVAVRLVEVGGLAPGSPRPVPGGTVFATAGDHMNLWTYRAVTDSNGAATMYLTPGVYNFAGRAGTSGTPGCSTEKPPLRIVRHSEQSVMSPSVTVICEIK